MGMVVQHNMNAINAYNRLNANVAGLKKASEKLASGYRINRAGDDAAGLAISEKMRSQIKGLNQAVRNSQDGINMIQTFEGAAQETHSILQRMKELATESANGTYDNTTDRAAIQLEFDQLNAELNQIADTDFNGTIVLNGGEMSDGLRVRNMQDGIGEFDYRNGNKIKDIETKITELKDELAAKKAEAPIDITKDNKIWGSLDEHGYQLDQAKDLWTDLKLDAAKDKYVDITYTAKVADDGTVTYEVTGAKSSTGADVDASKVTATAINGDANTTGMGGFKVPAKYGEVNALFDATQIKTGDVVTIRFTGPGEGPKAPTNIGFANDSLEFTGGVDTDETKYAVTLGTDVKDADMTDEIKEILDSLNGSEWELTIGNGAKGPANNTGVKIGGTAVAGGGIVTTAGGNKYIIETANDKIKVSTVDAAGTTADKELFTIDLTGAANSTAQGSVKFTLNIDAYSMGSSAGVDAEAVATEGVGDPKIEKEVATLQTKIDNLEKNLAVSKSDNFDNSTARMTYAENITLQTGARTKDSVNFTFKYNNDNTADMGELIPNLNLSSRADGLNTENLSLADQKSANHAIDQIDKAINKTSMVRASFGAIQNRLEHKITNLTTTSENLTEAESSIRDTDMASEMMNYTKFNILQQAAQSMLAQANQQPQSILQLLG